MGRFPRTTRPEPLADDVDVPIPDAGDALGESPSSSFVVEPRDARPVEPLSGLAQYRARLQREERGSSDDLKHTGLKYSGSMYDMSHPEELQGPMALFGGERGRVGFCRVLRLGQELICRENIEATRLERLEQCSLLESAFSYEYSS